MAAPPPRLAFVRTGDAEWIAGRIYLENIVRALSALPDGERPEVSVLAPGRDELGPAARLERYSYRAGARPLRRLARIVLRLRHGRPISLEEAARRAGAALVFGGPADLGPRFPIPWLTWIPDLQHRRLPHFFADAERQERDRRYERLVVQAAGVAVSSRDAQQDVERWFPAVRGRTHVLSFCTVPDPAWFDAEPQETAARFGLPEKYVILPSQFWAHKDHATVFEALRLLQAGGLEVSLVCTGSTKDYRWPGHFAALSAQLRRDGLDGRVHILGLLPRDQQVQLLRRAAAIVQPSLFEGWSALVEDARALGKRIYLSDLPVHREQEPGDAVFFQPGAAEELADAVAADWEGLRPGPDLEHEREARPGQDERTLAFGRRIVAVARDALSAERR